MPHDPNTVKLRGGAAVAKNVKLYPWTSAGSLDITAADSGIGVDVIRLDKDVVVSDLGSGSESLYKLINLEKVVSDSGTGSEIITVIGILVQKKQIGTDLNLFLLSCRIIKKLSASLKVYNVSIPEAELGDGNPARLYSASANNNEVFNTRSALIKPETSVTPRLTSDQKTPKGWRQGPSEPTRPSP